jgi:hypothetical protein
MFIKYSNTNDILFHILSFFIKAIHFSFNGMIISHTKRNLSVFLIPFHYFILTLVLEVWGLTKVGYYNMKSSGRNPTLQLVHLQTMASNRWLWSDLMILSIHE